MSHSARWFLGLVLAGCGAISANAQQSPGSPSPARSAIVADTLAPAGSPAGEVTLPVTVANPDEALERGEAFDFHQEEGTEEHNEGEQREGGE